MTSGLSIEKGEAVPRLLVYGPDKGNDKDRGDQHQPPGGDEAQRDEEDGARARWRTPHLGSPHEGEERGEEGQEDEDHASGEVPDLDRRLLDRVRQPTPGRIARLLHALEGAAKLIRPGVRRGELLEEGVGVEADGVAACLLLGGAGPAAAPASGEPARYLRDLEEEHLPGELHGALALAPARGDLRPDAPRTVLLASQAVDVLLVEITLGQRPCVVPQPVGLLERLRDPSLFHRLVFTPPYDLTRRNPRSVNDTTSTTLHTPLPARLFTVFALPQRIEQPAAAHPHVQVPSLGQLLEHPVGLRHRERGLHRRLSRRQLAVLPQGLEELPFLAVPRWKLRSAPREPRHTPDQQTEGREDRPTEHEDEPPEAGEQRQHRDPGHRNGY